MKLSFIIVNWNNSNLLKQCLESFCHSNLGLDFEIIVVDNGSTDDSVKMVQIQFPKINLINNSRNLGFAKANNQALQLARGEYILLLNSDTLIPDTLIFKQWLDFMDHHPQAGASGCMLVFPDGRHQVGDAGFKPTLRTVFNHAFFISRFSPQKLKGLFISYIKEPGPLRVDWISGAAFLVRKSILSQVGLMNEVFFMYAEDIEWGCRIRSYNYDVYYLPYIKIIHLQGASVRKKAQPEQDRALWIFNLRDLYLKLNRYHVLIAFDLLLALGFSLRSLIYLLVYWKTKDLRYRHKSTTTFQAFEFTRKQFGKKPCCVSERK